MPSCDGTSPPSSATALTVLAVPVVGLRPDEQAERRHQRARRAVHLPRALPAGEGVRRGARKRRVPRRLLRQQRRVERGRRQRQRAAGVERRVDVRVRKRRRLGAADDGAQAHVRAGGGLARGRKRELLVARAGGGLVRRRGDHAQVAPHQARLGEREVGLRRRHARQVPARVVHERPRPRGVGGVGGRVDGAVGGLDAPVGRDGPLLVRRHAAYGGVVALRRQVLCGAQECRLAVGRVRHHAPRQPVVRLRRHARVVPRV